MNRYTVIEDDILIAESNVYKDFHEIIQMIMNKYKNQKHYMTFSETDDKYS